MDTYEKKYREANDKVAARFGTNVAKEIFTDLYESEDERTRKEIIKYIEGTFPNESSGIESKNKWLAWLEKKSADKVEPKFKVGDRITKSSKKSCPVHSSIDDTICEVAEVHDTCYILNTKEGRIQEPFEWQDYYELVELAWSEEDERIRKELIDYINRLTASPLYIDKYNAWISWLEKQGKQMSDPRYSILDKLIEADDIYQMSVNDAMVEEAKNKAIEALSKLEISKLLGLEKQGGQKPVWGEEDERNFNDTILFIETGTYSLDKDNLINWLKSLRPKNTWKPSDEQIGVIEAVINNRSFQRRHLDSLYEQLKKLKGE